jgi:excisionase family DNA binding protein
MNAKRLKRLVQSRIDYLKSLDEVSDEDDYHNVRHFVQDVYGHAVAIGLPTVAAACNPGPPMIRLLEILRSFPEPTKQVYSLTEAADYLGYSDSGLRKIVKRGEIRFSQKGQGRIKFQREWLDEFLHNRRQVDRSPAQKQRAPISIEPEHGFDPSLLQADAHSGSE